PRSPHAHYPLLIRRSPHHAPARVPAAALPDKRPLAKTKQATGAVCLIETDLWRNHEYPNRPAVSRFMPEWPHSGVDRLTEPTYIFGRWSPPHRLQQYQLVTLTNHKIVELIHTLVNITFRTEMTWTPSQDCETMFSAFYGKEPAIGSMLEDRGIAVGWSAAGQNFPAFYRSGGVVVGARRCLVACS
ncbi:MAG: hypothetical protein M3N26_01115, partial [Pseudomonadota bacterium]|nr:hypothetical protein [Pseudomonadota bacterium]